MVGEINPGLYVQIFLEQFEIRITRRRDKDKQKIRKGDEDEDEMTSI